MAWLYCGIPREPHEHWLMSAVLLQTHSFDSVLSLYPELAQALSDVLQWLQV